MKILFVSNMYPNEKNPYFGIFVKEQKEALEKYCNCTIDTYVINGKMGYLKSLFEVPSLVKEKGYSIIHSHFGYSAIYSLISQYAAKRTIITFHGSDILMNHRWQDKVFKLLINKIIKRVSFNIVQNNEMAQFVKETNPHVSIITCGVDTEVFKPLPEVDITNPPILIFPSKKENPVKNWHLFEEVYNKLKEKYNIQYREIKDMNRNEVCYLFNEATCLVMTSNTEGSPQVVKEALACNCPVISVNVGDVCEQLSEVKNSFVTSTRNSLEIASRIESNLNKNLNRSNGSEAIIKKGFSQNQVATKIFDIYKRVNHAIQN